MQLKDKIFTIRNQQVMLDRDLAELYEVKTIRLREQLKRNIARFPQDFSFQLNEKETENMVSQNAIPSKKHLGGSLPHVFTEQGIAMLASVLNSKKAIDVNIKIMRAFVSMRKTMIQNASIFQKFQQIDQKLIEHDSQIGKILDSMQKELPLNQGVLFENQFFEAHILISKITNSAKESIILIDNYVNEDTLTLFSESKVPITILTKEISRKIELAVKKFNEQYDNLEIKEFNKSHDRFLIIDKKEVYFIGASLKDLGKKWFAFSKMKETSEILKRIS